MSTNIDIRIEKVKYYQRHFGVTCERLGKYCLPSVSKEYVSRVLSGKLEKYKTERAVSSLERGIQRVYEWYFSECKRLGVGKGIPMDEWEPEEKTNLLSLQKNERKALQMELLRQNIEIRAARKERQEREERDRLLRRQEREARKQEIVFNLYVFNETIRDGIRPDTKDIRVIVRHPMIPIDWQVAGYLDASDLLESVKDRLDMHGAWWRDSAKNEDVKAFWANLDFDKVRIKVQYRNGDGGRFIAFPRKPSEYMDIKLRPLTV